MKNKTLSILLAVLMSMAASMASAQSVGQIFEVDGICYQITSSTKPYTVAVSDDGSIEYTGSVTIPETVSYNGKVYSVTSIGDYAFEGCSGLTSVTIPNSVIYIEERAFYGCSGLTSVTIPNSVIYIGYEAFYGCRGLTSVTIPNSVTSIGDWAFYNCSGLTSVTIPNSVTSIGDYAFYGCCGLTSVTIPNSVTSIGNHAFEGCYFTYDSFIINNSTLHDAYIGGETWGAKIMDEETDDGLLIKDNIVLKCRLWATTAAIPEGITSIGGNAFSWCSSLISVTIPNSVTTIGDGAFYKCSGLTSVTIPNSVTSIGDYAFSSCTGLTLVTIPNSVTSIGNFAFWNCPLTRIYSYAEYPPSCGTDVFSVVKKNCKLYVLPKSVGLYKTNQDWKEFNILPMDEVALSVREVGTGKGKQEYYNLQGRRRAKRQHGLNIIRRSDGTTRQLLVK